MQFIVATLESGTADNHSQLDILSHAKYASYARTCIYTLATA